MNKNRRKPGKILSILLAIVLSFSCAFLFAYAKSDFESSIAAFPESYRVKLRALHEKYPKWTFEAMKTGIDWEEAVENENKYDKSLVEEAYSGDLFKSRASSDYNSSTGRYIYKDGGFVTASEMAVAFFMDPRNSLTESGIFQFLNLGFSSTDSVDTVENILHNSFMYDTKITYLTSSGAKKTASVTYGQAIYNAGKKYNINPSFLASKILAEIGSRGSGSSSGSYPGYAGIYNFYNIGATDGGDSVAKGLFWAKGGSSSLKTYSRPWTTPVKSIEGGAEFLAEQYIAEGQNTGYLQKFQVNPDADYYLYDHQYMTNVSGAFSQSYTTYLSYVTSGILAAAHHFIIPVYKNMPGEKASSSVLNFADGVGQTGSVSVSYLTMRTGPSTSYTATGVSLPKGAKVKLLSKVPTDSVYYLNVLKYPVWYNISYTASGKTYTGYVYEAGVNIVSETVLPVGKYSLRLLFSAAGSDDTLKVTSSDPSVAAVSGTTLTAKKAGSAVLTAYSPCGGFDKLKIKVKASPSPKAVTSLSFKGATSSVSLTWKAVSGAAGYNVLLLDANKKLVKSVDVTTASCKVSSLSAGEKFYAYVRSFTDASSVRTFSAIAGTKAVTLPGKPTSPKAKQEEDGLLLSWSATGKADGYEIAVLSDGKYTTVGSTSKKSFRIEGTTVNDADSYRVRAYVSHGEVYYGAYSDEFETDFSMLRVSTVTQSNTTASGYTLQWGKTEGAAGYLVCSSDKEDGEYMILLDTKNDSVKINSVSAGEKRYFKIQAYTVTSKGLTVTAEASKVYEASSLCGNIGKLSSAWNGKQLVLSWDKVKGADGYKVFVSDGEKLTEESDITKESYMPAAFSGKKVYSVCAYVKTGAGKITSESSESISVAYEVKEPSAVSSKSLDNGMRFTWESEQDADGCEVELYDSDLGTYIPMLTTENGTYTVYGLKDAQVRVRSFMRLSEGTKYSDYVKMTAKAE